MTAPTPPTAYPSSGAWAAARTELAKVPVGWPDLVYEAACDVCGELATWRGVTKSVVPHVVVTTVECCQEAAA